MEEEKEINVGEETPQSATLKRLVAMNKKMTDGKKARAEAQIAKAKKERKKVANAHARTKELLKRMEAIKDKKVDPYKPMEAMAKAAELYREAEAGAVNVDMASFDKMLKEFRDGNLNEAIKAWKQIKDPKDKLDAYLKMASLITPKPSQNNAADPAGGLMSKVLQEYREKAEAAEERRE